MDISSRPVGFVPRAWYDSPTPTAPTTPTARDFALEDLPLVLLVLPLGHTAPTRIMRTSFVFTTPPMPSISWRAYPGRRPDPELDTNPTEWESGLGVRWLPLSLPLALKPTLPELRGEPVVNDDEGDGVEAGEEWCSRASAASQSVSDSTSLAPRQDASRPHITPRLPSPMPVPPSTSPYWFRQRQILPNPVRLVDLHREEGKGYVRSVVLVCAEYIPAAGMAKPDTVALACANGSLHLVRVNRCAWEQRRPRESGNRRFRAGDAEPSMSVAEGRAARGSDNAVL